MSLPASNIETVELAKSRVPEAAVANTTSEKTGLHELDEKHLDEKRLSSDVASAGVPTYDEDGEQRHADHPTDEELATLRRVSGDIPWTAYTVAIVEFCERFSYYGTTAVFVNFIQKPLPPGSNTGAGFEGQSGALDMGQRASTGLTTFNSFWAYCMPLLGAYMADEHWGRYKTIMVAIGVALVGHTVLIISAIPQVIVNPDGAIACFAIGLVIMGLGTGGFKSNISPLIAEQYADDKIRVITLDTGERVIMDPQFTISRIFLYFYLMINLGSLTGSIGMVYAEKYVGFWLSFTLPTLLFLFCPVLLWACKSRYRLTPPTGSVTAKAMKLWGLAMKGRWSINPVTCYRQLHADDFWEKVMPSNIPASERPAWMTFDDVWVSQVRRGLLACKVFLWYPVYWLAYNQMMNNLVSQAATMELKGIPNDILSNLNPLSLIILIPICDQFIYPGLRKMGIHFTPIKRITCGFAASSLSMIWATVLQYYVYKLNPCGSEANSCSELVPTQVSPINVWVQTGPYVLVGMSEIFASITGLEYAFSKAPKEMKSLVTAFFLFTSAISSALSQALVALAEDPLLVWNYGVVAVLAACAGVIFWMQNRGLDQEEDHLNMLDDSELIHNGPSDVESR